MIVHIAIGSNIGEKFSNCRKALQLMMENGIKITKTSSFYETEPWGVKDQPNFINLAIEAETTLSPEELLLILKKIEDQLGRVETFKWGPRVIDLDILFYEDMVIEANHLKIPHPYLHKRDFVLLPLSEIAPEKVHPLLKKTISQLKEEYGND
ncbi:MAG: 2-amino-4-hydroxy-6-hydroxymethyldihydropteridine diphosphokinase [Thermodesulfovibrionales bacterium]|nr:2-amino-4-hydroxy-6-hydroxymethyldihydropteridine diphosphokinase [Thermodesulfovibrionales bacterium]